MHGIEITSPQPADHQITASENRLAYTNSTHNKSKIYKALSANLPLFIAFGSMAAGGILKQIVTAGISENAAELSALTGLITGGIIPIETGVFNIMLSEVFKLRDTLYYEPSRIGSIYQVNLLACLGFVLLSYPFMASAPAILNASYLDLGISDIDMASIQSCLNWNYATSILNAMYVADLLLYFQSRNLASAAISVFLGEILDVAICYLLLRHTGLGLSSSAISDFVASAVALMVSKCIQTGTIPTILKSTFPSMAQYELFNFNKESRARWPEIANKLFRSGALPWVASLSENITGAYSNIAFSSIGLQGALSVMQSACNNITGVILLSSSPYIAETDSIPSRKQAITKQFIGCMLPNLLVLGIGMAIPNQLSSAMGGKSMSSLTESQLRANIGLVMTGGLIANLLSVMYETFIDCSNTNWPSIIVIAGAFLSVGLDYAFANGVDSSEVGNYSLLMSSLATTLALTTYYCVKDSTYCSRPASTAAVLAFNKSKQTDLSTNLLENAA
ncbi:MAG: hypothetical protein Q7V63_01835 [Gammaproteobacteria bacterium]|nr:hypothetical protein [Gammaproteobacteria bacterium]